MRHRLLLPSAPLLLACLTAALSCSRAAPTKEATLVNPLPGSTWELQSIGREPVVADKAPWLRFDDTQVTGFGGVNRLRGTYSQHQDTLSFKQLISTKMAAVSPALNTQETNFLRALDTVSRF